MNGYDLTRGWYNYKFSNPDKVRHIHSDMYFYLVDKWNRLGQSDKFGLPTEVTMQALTIGSYNTYKKCLQDLIDFGFVILVKESKNQHQAKVIALSKIDKATDEALDKATAKASDKATDTINKHLTKNKEQIDIHFSEIIDRLNDKSNSSFKSSSEKTKGFIKSRFNEGFKIEDFLSVIDCKCKEWMQDPKMKKYLRPETLFGTKFESYLNESKQQEPQSFFEDKIVKPLQNNEY